MPLGVCDASANVTYVIHVMALLRDAGRHGEIYCVVVSKEREREREFFLIYVYFPCMLHYHGVILHALFTDYLFFYTLYI